MSRQGITYEKVAMAAQQLSDQGKNPTVEQVRLLLGTGSNTTLSHHLRNWKQGIVSLNPEIKENVPFALTSALKGLWEQLTYDAQDKIAKLEETYKIEISELQQELHKYKTNNHRWQQIYSQLLQEKTKLSQEKLSIEEIITILQKEVIVKTTKLDVQQQQLTEKQERVDDLYRLHKLAQDNL